jgi:hypothetical protein
VRPPALDYVEIRTGDVLDTVTLDGERLVYATGAAEPMFTDWRDRFGWAAAETYDSLTGWSNGYAALQPR